MFDFCWETLSYDHDSVPLMVSPHSTLYIQHASKPNTEAYSLKNLCHFAKKTIQIVKFKFLVPASFNPKQRFKRIPASLLDHSQSLPGPKAG